MQEYNTIQRQIDDLTGTISEQRHAEQRRFVEAMTRTNDSPTATEPLLYAEYSTENRAQRRERERQERRAAKKVKVRA